MNAFYHNAPAPALNRASVDGPSFMQDDDGDRWLVFVKICLGKRTLSSRVDHDWCSESAVRAMLAEIADRGGCIWHLGSDGTLVEFLDLDIALNCALALHRRGADSQVNEHAGLAAQYVVALRPARGNILADEAATLAAGISERLARVHENRGVYLFFGDRVLPGDGVGEGIRIIEDPGQPRDGDHKIRVRMSAIPT